MIQQYVQRAEAIGRMVPLVLKQRGLDSMAITHGMLTQTAAGDAWLFLVLDVTRLTRLEAYTSPDLVHQLRTVLRGLPVVISNSTGLRYAVLLSKPRKLPKRTDFPGIQDGQALIGVRPGMDTLSQSWADLGHLLVAGISGSGKSVFLRLLAYQALAEGMQLLISDLDGTTFPMLADHPQLMTPIADSPAMAEQIVRQALEECVNRKVRYAEIKAENIDEYNQRMAAEGGKLLPHVMVILDEYGASVSAAGGPDGDLSRMTAELAWRGRKFGIHLVLAAQDISKAVIGKVRDHVKPIAFRLSSYQVARALGCQAAVRIPANRPGLAVTPWGLVQTYYLERDAFAMIPSAGLDDKSRELAKRLLEQGGKATLDQLEAAGLGQREARRLLASWEARGWVQADPAKQNGRYITPALADKLTNLTN